MDDVFEILGVPRRFDVDEAELHRRFIAASARTHPDRFADPVAQADASQRSAAVNGAYRVLRDPQTRAEALMVLLGGPVPEADKSLPPDLLMQMMDIREEMQEAIEAVDTATLDRLRTWAQQQRAARLEAIAALFDRAQAADCHGDELKRARLELNALRYVRRMLEQMPE